MPVGEAEIVEALRDAAPQIRFRMADMQKEVIKYRGYKKLFKKKLTGEREPSKLHTYRIHKVDPSPYRIIITRSAPLSRSETSPDPASVAVAKDPPTTEDAAEAVNPPAAEIESEEEEEEEAVENADAAEDSVEEIETETTEVAETENTAEPPAAENDVIAIPTPEIVVESESGEEKEDEDVSFKRRKRPRDVRLEDNLIISVQENETLDDGQNLVITNIITPTPVPHPSQSSPFLPPSPSDQTAQPPPAKKIRPLLSISFAPRPPTFNPRPIPRLISYPFSRIHSPRPLMRPGFRAPAPFLRSPAPVPPRPQPPPRLPSPVPAQPQPHRGSSAIAAGPDGSDRSTSAIVREYDEKMISIMAARLGRAGRSDFATILEMAQAPKESMMRYRFLETLKALRRNDGERQHMYAVARAMLLLLPLEARQFVFSVLDEKIFGENRLNAIVRLQFFFVSPMIILDDLFAQQPDTGNVELAARNFPVSAIVDVMKFAAVNSKSVSKIVEKMREKDCFTGNYANAEARSRYSEKRVRDFVASLCANLEIDVPAEARPLFMRLQMDSELESFFKGETEVADFYHLCISCSKDEESLFRFCYDYVAEKSNPLARFLAEMRGYSFSPKPTASDYVPECAKPFNRELHREVSDRTVFINDGSTISEFEKHLDSSRHIAIFYHYRTESGDPECDLIAIKTRERTFFYSMKISRPCRSKVVAAFSRYIGDKRVFVFRATRAISFLQKEFSWQPANIVDSGDLARDRGIGSTFTSIIADMYPGSFCRRGSNFSCIATPSAVALNHIDMNANALYEFCVLALNLRGAEIRDLVMREPRNRQRDDARNRNSDNRSRSRHFR